MFDWSRWAEDQTAGVEEIKFTRYELSPITDCRLSDEKPPCFLHHWFVCEEIKQTRDRATEDAIIRVEWQVRLTVTIFFAKAWLACCEVHNAFNCLRQTSYLFPFPTLPKNRKIRHRVRLDFRQERPHRNVETRLWTAESPVNGKHWSVTVCQLPELKQGSWSVWFQLEQVSSQLLDPHLIQKANAGQREPGNVVKPNYTIRPHYCRNFDAWCKILYKY